MHLPPPKWILYFNLNTLKKIFSLVILFFTFFILLNPGLIVEPIKFFEDVYLVRNFYTKLGYGFFHTEAGYHHLKKFFQFLALVLSSSYKIISIIIFLISIIGLIFYKKYFKLKFILFLIPFIYILYFSSHVAMTVNNYLFILPFLAIFFSMGVDVLINYHSSKIYKFLLFFFLITIFSFNFHKINSANNSLKFNNKIITNQLKNYLIQNKNEKIIINSNVYKFLNEEDKQNLELININDVSKFDFLLYVLPDYANYFAEVDKKFYNHLANNIGVYSVIAGPNDINLDYFPTYMGFERVVRVSAKHFENYLRFFGGGSFKYYLWQ
jgi:hypothetical protein